MGKKRSSARRSPSAAGAPPGGRVERAAGRAGRRDLLWALGLSALAWLHRALFLWSNRDREWPFTIFYEGDAETFFRFARAILRGEVYDAGIPFHPPGFPYFLAGVYTFLGAEPEASALPNVAIKLTLAAVSSLAIGLLYLLVKPYLGRPAALLAALLGVYHFGLYVVAIAPVSEGLYLTLLVLALLVWSRTLDHPLAAPGASPDARRAPLVGLGLGLLLGVLCLIRAESALVAVLLGGVGVGGWLWRRLGSRRSGAGSAPVRALLPWILLAVGWIVALTPWTVRNAHHLAAANERLAGGLAEPLPTFVPLTLYGPLNLALANHAGADGTFSRDLMTSQTESGQLQLTNPQHLRFLLHGDEMAWEFVREHPGDFARLVLRKWGLYFQALRLGFTQWNVPGGLAGERRPVDLFAPDSALAAWILAPAVLLGLLLALRAGGGPRRWALLVLLLTAAGLFTTTLFYGYVRQGVLQVPFWLSLIAYAAAAALRLAPPRDAETLPRRFRAAVAVAVALLFVLAAWGATANRNYRATGTTLPGSQRLNRDLAVHLEPLPE